ncbi:MAG: OmpA family protein [Mycoplasmataceae bacterium]|nr:OmpA family protein [Mycoplasmataceae bacterium]
MKLLEKKQHLHLVASLFLFSITSVQANVDCAKAASYFQQSNSASNETQEKKLLESSLSLCPDYADAHNNLGVLLENQVQLKQALSHYQKAVTLKPDFSEAWYGIGDIYRKQKQLPLALEAYLKICSVDTDAKKHVKALIKENRYKTSESGETLNSESLLVIYDKSRQAVIKTQLNNCGIQVSLKSVGRQKSTFRNLSFTSGSAVLNPDSKKQLNQIAATLLNLSPNKVRIVGHTDKQRYQGKNDIQSKSLNKGLSKNRAESIKQYLVEAGVSAGSLITVGAGSTQLLDGNDLSSAHAKNRRVEIEFLD